MQSSPSSIVLLSLGALLVDMLAAKGSTWGRDLGPTPSLLDASATIVHDGIFVFGNNKYSAWRLAASMLRSQSTAYFNNNRRVRFLSREGVHNCNEYHQDPTSPPAYRGAGTSTLPDVPRVPSVTLAVPVLGPRGAAIAALTSIMTDPPASLAPSVATHKHSVRAT
ncbi:hypothetical protein OH76DRAFT_1491118 [Lentinus brumalis]|uniref:Uncharacterized protein n=1 Tax=Lentinus brumalis TaxID=2498619 RepID=A0A371CGQ6_9APHY|nr:hypothetical protein OH76DRAFT_1491118 [Polyporus brumalis]